MSHGVGFAVRRAAQYCFMRRETAFLASADIGRRVLPVGLAVCLEALARRAPETVQCPRKCPNLTIKRYALGAELLPPYSLVHRGEILLRPAARRLLLGAFPSDLLDCEPVEGHALIARIDQPHPPASHVAFSLPSSHPSNPANRSTCSPYFAQRHPPFGNSRGPCTRRSYPFGAQSANKPPTNGSSPVRSRLNRWTHVSEGESGNGRSLPALDGPRSHRSGR